MRESDLDEWWGALPPRRKEQIHSWLSKEPEYVPHPDQIPIFEGPEQKGEKQ